MNSAGTATDTVTVPGIPGIPQCRGYFSGPVFSGQANYNGATAVPAQGFAHGFGPYGHYPHGLSTTVANRFTQPYNGFPTASAGGPEAYPGSFPGNPGLYTGAQYPYSQPLPSAGGSYGSNGFSYGAAGLPHPKEHHGYRPGGRGHWGFESPKY